MRRAILKRPLNLDYTELFGKSWIDVLTPLLASSYMFNLMALINEIYSLLPNQILGQGFVYPYKSRLFTNFRACDWINLKVVIVGREPYQSHRAIGVPFATHVNNNNVILEDDLILIERCIRKNIYNNSTQYVFDESLSTWGMQGVFLIDAASTSEETSKNAHSIIWKNFTREVIKIISSKKTNIIFLLWGAEAKYFSRYIDREKHHVLVYDHPSDAKTRNTDWNCTHFKSVNDILLRTTENNEEIDW